MSGRITLASVAAAALLVIQLCSGCSSPLMNRWPYQVFPIDDSRTAYIYFTSRSDYCWRRALVMEEEDGKRHRFSLDGMNAVGDICQVSQDTIFMMRHTFHNGYLGDTTIVEHCGTLHGARDYEVVQTVHYHLDGSALHWPYDGVETRDHKYLVDRITATGNNKAVLWYGANAVATVDIDKLHYNDRDGAKEFQQCIIDTTQGHLSRYRDGYGVLSLWVRFKPTSDTVIEDYFNGILKGL